jgi:hypothetical protein
MLPWSPSTNSAHEKRRRRPRGESRRLCSSVGPPGEVRPHPRSGQSVSGGGSGAHLLSELTTLPESIAFPPNRRGTRTLSTPEQRARPGHVPAPRSGIRGPTRLNVTRAVVPRSVGSGERLDEAPRYHESTLSAAPRAATNTHVRRNQGTYTTRSRVAQVGNWSHLAALPLMLDFRPGRQLEAP